MGSKWYRFVTVKSGQVGQPIDEAVVWIEEKDLTEPQKSLLLGELIKLFNDSPDEIQTKFLHQIVSSVRDYVSPQKQKFIDEQREYFVKLMDDDIQKEIIKELKDGKK